MLGIPSLLASSAFDFDDSRTYKMAVKNTFQKSLGNIPGANALATVLEAAYDGRADRALNIHPIGGLARDTYGLFNDSPYYEKTQPERMARILAQISGLPRMPITQTASVFNK